MRVIPDLVKERSLGGTSNQLSSNSNSKSKFACPASSLALFLHKRCLSHHLSVGIAVPPHIPQITQSPNEVPPCCRFFFNSALCTCSARSSTSTSSSFSGSIPRRSSNTLTLLSSLS